MEVEILLQQQQPSLLVLSKLG
jgi:hypothetical protein